MEPTIVPLVIGLTVASAKELLEGRGLVVSLNPADADADAIVVDQSLRPGGGQIGDEITISTK